VWCLDLSVAVLCWHMYTAGFAVPFTMKYLIETYNPPDIKHPPTVKEVRHTVCVWGLSCFHTSQHCTCCWVLTRDRGVHVLVSQHTEALSWSFCMPVVMSAG
jgi:hypothetical protein